MKTLQKAVYLSMFLFFAMNGINAQKLSETTTEPNTSKYEIGLSLNSDRAFAFELKKKRKEDQYWRLTGEIGQLSYMSLSNSFNAHAGLFIGLEKRKFLSKKIWINYGPEIGGSILYNTLNSDYIFSPSVQAGYFVGINYNINNNLYIGAEIKPNLNYSATYYSRLSTTRWQNLDLRTTAKFNLFYKF